MKKLLAAAALFIASTAVADVHPFGGPRSTNNDDSCDIALLPAATLLLPYFEVDLYEDRLGETTLFSVTNVTDREQIAHVTLWTDYAYPVLAFDLYLTGYDVQSINLYDVIRLGVIGSNRGTGTNMSPEGNYSSDNDALDRSACSELPATIAPELVTRIQQAFTLGRIPALGDQPACTRIGSSGHANGNAIGYATIDVVSACNSRLTPADASYYDGTLRYDNVLMGDFLQVNSGRNSAQGSPMVHIRAIPEGGTAATRAANPPRYSVNAPRTFYGRFLTGVSRAADGRQPLPSRFAARWIEGGTGSFATSLTIWREGREANAICHELELRAATETVTFDEDENANANSFHCPGFVCPVRELIFPSTARVTVDEPAFFPRAPNDAPAGWIYLNLDDPHEEGATQAWVVSMMSAQERFSVATDVVALGNGCSSPEGVSQILEEPGIVIGPSGNVNP